MIEIFSSIKTELESVKHTLTVEIPMEGGVLSDVLQYIFSTSGKLLRPSLILTLAKAIYPNQEPKEEHYHLAILTELMHTATLLHDDVIDEADTRRGRDTIHKQWNNNFAIIGGDYLFARASKYLSQIGINKINAIYAELLMSLCQGEIKQAKSEFDLDSLSLAKYIEKSELKTAIMFAASAQSSAIICDASQSIVEASFLFAKNLGIAFQIIDDLIDFTSTSDQLGKPQMGDIANGIYTAPILFALNILDNETPGHIVERLYSLLHKKTISPEILDLLREADAFLRTYRLASRYMDIARSALNAIPASIYREDLVRLTDFIMDRQY